MAEVEGMKISQAAEIKSPKGTEYFPVANGGTQGKVSLNTMKEYATSELKERMDEVENKVFPLTVSVSGGGTFEKGVPKDITVKWTLKKGDSTVSAESVTVNDEPASGTSKLFSGVTQNTTYTVKAVYQGKTAQGSTSATFVAPMYFGFAAATEAASLEITSLGKQSIKTSPGGSYTLNNATTGHYLWLCVPGSMTISRVTSSGFDVPMEAAEDGSTPVDSYKCYRSSSPINEGAMSIVIS